MQPVHLNELIHSQYGRYCEINMDLHLGDGMTQTLEAACSPRGRRFTYFAFMGLTKMDEQIFIEEELALLFPKELIWLPR